MSILKRLFGGAGSADPKAEAVPGPTVEDMIEQIQAAAQPCVRLTLGPGGQSWLGGEARFLGPWPRFQGAPLTHVAHIDLAEVRAAGGPDWLPAEGHLAFFYDMASQGWGLGPEEAGCAVAIHQTGPAPSQAPPADLPQDLMIPSAPVRCEAASSYPPADRLGLNTARLKGRDYGRLEAAEEALLPSGPAHQIGGFPFPVQADEMEADCEQNAPREPGRRPGDGAAEWRLLLQLDSDDRAEMAWSDSGRLYFWIREVDARAGDFTRIWTILQSC